MHLHYFEKSTKLILLILTSNVASLAEAQFVPIALTPDSFNEDIVVERASSAPLVPVTTATMDGGISNTGYTWYERGFKSGYPATGLPAAGSIRSSEAVGDHEYLFPASYAVNNALMIDPEITRGALKFLNPAAYSVLSFLVSGGNGGGNISYTLHHQDGTTQNGSFLCRDWINGQNAAYTSAGRINVTSYVFDMNNTNPRLYASDIAVTNNASPVESVDFAYISGSGREVVFAISGAPFDGDPVGPIRVSGCNVDMVVEADSTRPDPLTGFTTATMEDGEANAGNTWYEAGYYPPAPTSGLPAPGALVSSETAPDHQFRLAQSFTEKNAVLLDDQQSSVNLIPMTPAAYSAISLLTSAGNGPVTNRCVVSHADGTSQTNAFISPDWLDSSPMALCGNGRVQVGKRLVDNVNEGYPRLFAVDFELKNTVSPVTNLLVSFVAGALYSHSVIFAVSGADHPVQPPAQQARLCITSAGPGQWMISSSAPGELQSTDTLKGSDTLWTVEGPISTTVTITQTQQTRFYRVVSR